MVQDVQGNQHHDHRPAGGSLLHLHLLRLWIPQMNNDLAQGVLEVEHSGLQGSHIQRFLRLMILDHIELLFGQEGFLLERHLLKGDLALGLWSHLGTWWHRQLTAGACLATGLGYGVTQLFQFVHLLFHKHEELPMIHLWTVFIVGGEPLNPHLVFLPHLQECRPHMLLAEGDLLDFQFLQREVW